MKLVAPPASAPSEDARDGHRLIVGAFEVVEGVYVYIDAFAPYDFTVLILGPTGSGKTLVARELHRRSLRAKGPFVRVTITAIPETLLESELFGHEKWAFNDARELKLGLVEMANGGTLFLDEIGRASMAVQVKLLQFLDDKTFYRVGGTELRRADVRIVAATNRDLDEAVSSGEFLEDLRQRMSQFVIALTGLGKHPESIPFLVKSLLKKLAPEFGRDFEGITDEAMQRLLQHPFRGEVRELQNILTQAMALAKYFDRPWIELKHLPPYVLGSALQSPLPHHVRGDIPSREEIIEALNRNGWKITKTAAEFGVTDRALRDWLKQYGIKRPD
jgi:DNA-binding NtrC family response regulator